MENGNLKALRELRSLLVENKIIHFAGLNEARISEMLDARDSVEFESDWLQTFNNLEMSFNASPEQPLITEIREIAYQKTYDLTQHSELSAYVSDDFELIAKSFFSGYTDEWLNLLFLSYLQGIFPHTKLMPKKNGLELILETLSLNQIAT